MTLAFFRALLAVLAVVVLVGCAEAENPQPQARFPDEGLQTTGQLAGKRIAVSSGNPTVTFGDCDPEDGIDEDLCITARTIDGEAVTVVIENPAALSGFVDGEIPVDADPCRRADCDDITTHAVVDVRSDGEVYRALSGTIRPNTVRPGHVAARFRFTLRGGGRLTGSFNVTG